MENQTYIITFKGVSEETASLYASELRNALLDATPDIDVEQRRAEASTQDFGSTLVVVLGTPAVLAVVKALGDWLQKRHSAVIDIAKDGHIRLCCTLRDGARSGIIQENEPHPSGDPH